MSPKQFKLTHSLFSFQRISQADGVKRKQTKANESICPPQRKKRSVSLKKADGSDGAVESVQMKENMQPILEAEGLQRNEDGTGEIGSPPTPWHPSHALVEPTWQKLLRKEFQMKYMTDISDLSVRVSIKFPILFWGVSVFPPRPLIFNAFNLTPFNTIRVVVIGQDPYHNLGQAHGLCFSVPIGQPMPPSLKNIFKELSSEFPDFVLPKHGTLTKWATQGVFLLNASLTVQAHKANSHANIGWQLFTDSVIRLISSDSPLGVVFLLWGAFAHKKEALIDKRRHRIVKAAHPSPLSAYRFFGCKCFSKTNDALKEIGREPIEWTAL
ncbi:hypothetical protein niasHS_006732 [Heterodera schachtii]|uniref:Uracil-DNA glycosylase n=1 Tax=Heterodera schachtii TaxID=97005 RepID=A0ABD2JI79_HETSC